MTEAIEQKQDKAPLEQEPLIQNEEEFWIRVDPTILTPEPMTKRTNDIENAVSQGTTSTYRQLERSVFLDENDIRAFAKYADHPFIGPIILKYIVAKRHLKGWIVSELKDFYKYHVKTIQNELFSKKVKKALNKIADLR